jgi:phosphoglycerate dehydrogenase-like enzyme
VFEREPLPDDSPLWDLPNCYISAHCSGPSEPDLVRTFVAENIRRYLAGEPLAGVVDRSQGY